MDDEKEELLSTKKLPRGIQKRKYEDGRTAYRVRFRVPTPDGKRKHASKEFPTLELAQQFRDRTAKTLARTGRLTLEAFCNRFWKPHAEATHKASTQHSEQARLENHILPVFGKQHLDSISRASVTQFLQSLDQLSPKTKQNIFALFHAVLQYAVDEIEVLDRNPLARAAGSRKNKLRPVAGNRKEKPALDPAQFAKLLAATTESRRPLVWTFAITGLRASEVAGLKWGDYNPTEQTMSIRRAVVRGVVDTPKTEHTIRQVGVPAILTAQLDWQKVYSKIRLGRDTTPDDFIFCSPSGRPFNPDSARREILHPALKRAGIDPASNPRGYGWHLFRHSAGTALLQQTKDMHAASRYLGHSSIGITEKVYIHAKPDAVKHAEAVATYWQSAPSVPVESAPQTKTIQ